MFLDESVGSSPSDSSILETTTMTKSKISVLVGAFVVLSAGAIAFILLVRLRPAPESDPPLDPEPIVFNVRTGAPAKKQKFSLPGKRRAPTAEPRALPGMISAKIDLVRADIKRASAGETLWAYKSEICACRSPQCMDAINDFYAVPLSTKSAFDNSNSESRAMIEEIKGCIAASSVREDPSKPVTAEALRQRAEAKAEFRRADLAREAASAPSIP